MSPPKAAGEVKQQVVDQIVAIADEGVMVFFLDKHLDVAVDAIVLACISLAGYVHHHTLSHTCGDIDFDDLLAFLDTGATTVLALVLDHLALTVAGGADALLLHHAEDALRGVGDDTLSVTGGTGLLAAAGLGSRAAAVGAGDILAHLKLLCNAFVDLFQRKLHLQAEVAAAMLLRAARTAEASETVTAEDVAEH